MAISLPADASATTLAGLLKRVYPPAKMRQLFEQDFPFLAEVKKTKGLSGSGTVVPVTHDRSNVGNNFNAAQLFRSPASHDQFLITGIAQYGVGRLDGITMMKMKSDAGAFAQGVKTEVESVLHSMKEYTAYQLYGGAASHYLAVISGTPSANVITLTNKSDAYRFHVGQKLAIADAVTGGTPRTGGGADFEVVSTDPDAGTITVDNDGDAASGDYIFNFSEESSASGLTDGGSGSISGLGDWCPSTAATDTFFGVARTGKVRLYGSRITDTSLTTESAIQQAAYKCAQLGGVGGSKWRCYMHPFQYNLLIEELGSKVQRGPGGKGIAGFDSVAVHTSVGTVECVGDPACPETSMWVVDLSTFELCYLGDELFHMANESSLSLIPIATADSVEFRYRSFRQLICRNPSRNCYIARSTAI